MTSHSHRSRKLALSRAVRHPAQPLMENLEERVMLAATPIGSVDVFSSGMISGWAHDADQPASSITVRITVDGVVNNVTANASRPDLIPIFGSGNFGFSFNPNLAPGSHTVTVAAIDPDTNTPAIMRTGTIVNNGPIGSVDIINSTRIAGWAFDKDAGASPINIRIDVNGATVQTISANTPRSDLAFLGSTAHGFSVNGSFNGVIDVWAIDAPTGRATLLKTTNRTSIGSVDVFTRNQVAGWVFDPDRPNAAVTVRVKVDGAVVAEVPANGLRPDIASVTGGSTAHGFTVNLTLPPGTHTVQVVAVESDTTSVAETVLATAAAASNPPPIGSLDIVNRVVAAGWAFDPDAGATPVTVQIKVDGAVIGTTTANRARPDLVSATGSPNHGFVLPYASLPAGPHTVEMDALDVPTGTAVKIASVNIDNTKPIGSLDVARPDVIAGWAFDSDTPGTAVQVVYDLDGTRYTPVTADQNRPDLTAAIGSAAHGFSSPMPTHLFGTHTVSVFAVDTFDGTQTLIGTRVFTNHAPIGSIDVLNSTSVSGWVYDPDAPTKSLTVLIRIDGTITSQLVASNVRNDLTSFIGSPNHGFGASLGALAAGSHKVEIFAADPATGVTTLIGSKTIVR